MAAIIRLVGLTAEVSQGSWVSEDPSLSVLLDTLPLLHRMPASAPDEDEWLALLAVRELGAVLVWQDEAEPPAPPEGAVE